ncbi:SDR family oxidoreductase [Aureliella helgolandensis]|uniref:SDR family oxidoreductase n=1 Tax=Aureliella helgolandensis TaxID=2527968 RepID=UPI0018D15F4C|nr:SDR family oxidoreductase [Aureliella helgolandensis]
MQNHILLTGGTGLLGRYLLRDLLLKQCRLALLVRPSQRESCQDRTEAILQAWETELDQVLPRPVVLEGDICAPYLGLSERDRDWLSENCNTALHSAASLEFHEVASGEPYRSNIGGVKNMLDVCEQVGINQFHYVSTAYVAGLRPGVVKECELDVGQEFRNDYEKSKCEAEKLVRQATCFDSLTVYRPAVISGDSVSGYTSTYHGLYLYLKLMSILVRNTPPGPDGVRDTPVRTELTGDEKRNVIPVDWVSEVMTHLVTTPESHGLTYHLAPEIPLTPREMIEAGYTYFNSRGVIFEGPSAQATGPISEIDRNAHENIGMYREYEECDPSFDLTNLRKHAGHIPCPPIDEAMLHRYLKFGEADRWGKRRPPATKPYNSIQQQLEALLSPASETLEYHPLRVNLFILGPGGGDWKLSIQQGQLVAIERGSYQCPQASIETDTKTLESLQTSAALESEQPHLVLQCSSENQREELEIQIADALQIRLKPEGSFRSAANSTSRCGALR